MATDPMSSCSPSSVGWSLLALLATVASCAPSKHLYLSDYCDESRPCSRQGAPFCDRLVLHCKACPTDPTQYRRCDARDVGADCFSNEDCRDLGAGIGAVCVPRECVCSATSQRICDPTDAIGGCGPSEKCLTREADAGSRSGRCVPYSCGWCDSAHPCTSDPSKPFCQRPIGGWPTCVACPTDPNELHACDPTGSDGECFSDETCLANLPGAAAPSCVPNACRCQLPWSSCDPARVTTGCRPDEKCVLTGIAGTSSLQCYPYACGLCDANHPCTADPARPFCQPFPRDPADQQVYGIRFSACTAGAAADGGE